MEYVLLTGYSNMDGAPPSELYLVSFAKKILKMFIFSMAYYEIHTTDNDLPQKHNCSKTITLNSTVLLTSFRTKQIRYFF